MRYIAKTLLGLEGVLAGEIKSLGGKKIKILNRAVEFEGGLSLLYKSNLMLRTAISVLIPITAVEVNNDDELYNEIFALPWYKIMGLKQTFSVKATVSGYKFTHSKYAALKTKDAIVDKFRMVTKDRPNVNPVTPDIIIDLHIVDNKLSLALDSSGDSLFKRGYRVHSVEAPLNEVLAAGIILRSGWKGNSDFWDPMCGSGTIPIEAARIALNIPPQSRDRKFSFMHYPNYNEELFNQIVTELFEKGMEEFKYRIKASDKSIQALKYTQFNLKESGLEDLIETERIDFFKTNSVSNTTIILNPPYNERLKIDDIKKYYKELGEHIESRTKDCDIWMITGYGEALDYMGVEPVDEIDLMNGAIPSKLYHIKT